MSQVIRDFTQFITADTTAALLIRVGLILVLTWLATIIAGGLAPRLLKARAVTWRDVSERRLVTLEALVASAMKVAVYVAGLILLLLSFGLPGASILTAAALFSAGFGFAARPIISDYLTGIIFIFEDQFSVGDKVEMMEVVGVVEAVDLRVTRLRSPSGELYIIPNGDVRVVRNLTRGQFSIATIRARVATKDLTQTIHILEQVADTAQGNLPDLIERPEFLSEEGKISAHVELTLSAKTTYGQGARLRTRLMTMVTDALDEAGVAIIN